MDYTKELELAALTVQRASKLTKSILAAVDKGALDKKDNTPVTIADFAAQALIISAVHAVFPEDGFVGEESAAALRESPELLERVWGLVSSFRADAGNEEKDGVLATPSTPEEMLSLIDLGGKGQGGSRGRVWVLDPVDGTATFIRGQQYVVCLALLVDGEQQIGVLGCPNLPVGASRVHEEIVDRHGDGQMIYAVAGQGAYIRPMNYSSLGLLESATPIPKYPANLQRSDLRFVDCKASNSTDYEKHALVASKLGVPWPASVDLWSAQMRYVAVILNGGGNMLIKILQRDSYRSCLWDHVGGMLIAQEVGCVVTDLRGKPIDCGLGRTLAGAFGLICAPASVYPDVFKAVQDVVGSD